MTNTKRQLICQALKQKCHNEAKYPSTIQLKNCGINSPKRIQEGQVVQFLVNAA